MAGGAIEANSCCTVINVLTAIISSPAINTNTSMAANGVEAGTPVMAGIGLHETLIDIFSTVLSFNDKMTYRFIYTNNFINNTVKFHFTSCTCPFRWTLAVVGIDSIYTYSSIHALVTWTVIHIILTVVSLKPWNRFREKGLQYIDKQHPTVVSLINLPCLFYKILNISSPTLESRFPHWRKCGVMWAVKEFKRCLTVYVFVWLFPHNASNGSDSCLLQRSALPSMFACFIISHSFNDFLSGRGHFLSDPQWEPRRSIK